MKINHAMIETPQKTNKVFMSELEKFILFIEESIY